MIDVKLLDPAGFVILSPVRLPSACNDAPSKPLPEGTKRQCRELAKCPVCNVEIKRIRGEDYDAVTCPRHVEECLRQRAASS